jgi:predicted RNA-binding Zn-ribbon protein involved in translation (DUF1610 family)
MGWLDKFKLYDSDQTKPHGYSRCTACGNLMEMQLEPKEIVVECPMCGRHDIVIEGRVI